MHDAQTHADLVPNARLGHYVIIEHVTDGGMGSVYKGFEASLQREVAIKVLKPELAAEKDKLASFDLEAQNIAALRHANIVPIYFVGHQGELHYFVMPFITGTTLDDWIESETPLNTEQAAWVLNQAIEALDWARQHNIIHLDIKPSNFLVDSNGVIYLTDFGLAQTLGHAPDSTEGECFGTPAYMSPEQILQQPPDQRSDIYSLGAALYHLMTCKFLYNGDTVSDIIQGHLHGEFPYAEAEAAGLSPGWIALIQKMAQREPSARYQNYAELREAFYNVGRLVPISPHAQRVVENPVLLPVPQRSGLPKERLFGLLSQPYQSWASGGVDQSIQRSRDELVRGLDNPMKPMKVEQLVKPLQEIGERAEVDTADMADALGALPELERYMIALANVPLVQKEQPINTPRKAMQAIGLDLSRQLILTDVMIRKEFKPGMEFDLSPYWNHAMSVGLVARWLLDMILGDLVPGQGRVSARSSKGMAFLLGRGSLQKARDNAYLAGLIHGIGKLVFAELQPFPYYSVMRTAIEKLQPLTVVERDMFGMDNQEMGSLWLGKQRFEGGLRQVVGSYEMCDQKLSPLAAAVALANQMVKIHGLGYSGSPVIEFRDLWNTRAWEDFKSAGKVPDLTPELMEREFLPAVGQIPLLDFSRIIY